MLEMPFRVSPSPLSLKNIKIKNQAKSDLQDSQNRIFAVRQVKATQNFISPEYLKFDLCHTSALFYQLSH